MILPDNIEDMPYGTELVTPIEDEVMNVLRGKLEAWFNKKIDDKQVNFMEVKELHETEIENKNEIQGEELYDLIIKNQEIQESKEKGEMKNEI